MAGPLPRLRRRRRPARAAPRRRDRRGRAGAARRPAARHDPAAKRRPVPQRVLRRHGLAGPRERPARGAPGRARPRPTRPTTADLGTGPHRPAPLGGHRRPRRRRLLEHDTRLQERPRQRTRRAPSGPDRGRHRRPVARRVDVCAPAGPGLRPVPRRRAAGRRRGGRRPRRLDVQPGDGAGCPRHPGRCPEPDPGGPARRRGPARSHRRRPGRTRHPRRPRRRPVHRHPRPVPRPRRDRPGGATPTPPTRPAGW